MPSIGVQKPILIVALATVLLLLVPAIAMQLTSEVNWGAGDFVAAGVLIFGAGSITVLGLRLVSGRARRAALVAGVGLGLALVWAELAVGLFT
jgi:hypothetical protein